MRAAVLNQIPGSLEVKEVRLGSLGPKEVLVKVVGSGLCRSDLHMMDGTHKLTVPAVLGHEGAGIVDEVGSEVTYVKPGDHVIACASACCGNCEMCLTGHYSMCDNRQTFQRPATSPPRLETLDGKPLTQYVNQAAFAEYMLIHENSLVKIRDDMPLELAGPVGCGVSTGIGAVINTAKVAPGTTVAIIGCGGVGLSAVAGARIAGAGRIIAVDTVPSKLELARKFGATDVIDASKKDVVKAVQDLTRGQGVDYSFEVVGLKKTMEQAFQILRKGGVATIVGSAADTVKIELTAFHLLYERRIQGTNMGSIRPRVDIPRYVDMYMQGRLDLETLVSRKISLDDINAGFEAMKSGEVARSVIVFR